MTAPDVAGGGAALQGRGVKKDASGLPLVSTARPVAPDGRGLREIERGYVELGALQQGTRASVKAKRLPPARSRPTDGDYG